MLDPVELQLFPSCYNCISWSADGELAVAAGEYIHILTPKIAGGDVDEQQPTSQTTTTASPWSFTRFRANVFTNKEWPTTYPQNRDNFSIGPEQSISTVAGLAWSPPGLATHKRCVLAVLTTNLLLSFFEPTGPQGKWVRVAVVNHALKSQFFFPSSSSSSSSSRKPESSGIRARKRAIRAFAWNPPIKAKGAAPARAESESRWGVHLLTVANDDNDVILLRVKRQRGELVSDFHYSTEVLSVLPFNDDASGNFPMVQPSTMLSAAIRSRVRASHIACGPWVCQQAEGDESRGRLSAKAAVAIVYGTRLKIVRLDVTLVPKDRQVDFGSEYTLEAKSAEHASTASDKRLGTYHFTGPVQWLFENGLQSVCLAAGISAGLVTLRMSRETYEGKITDPKGIRLQERSFLEDSSTSSSQADGYVQTHHWEPISAIAAICDEKTGASTLHLGTMAGYADSYSCPSLQEGHFVQPEWKKQLEDFRERFDIDRDLGGLAVARVWGLTCHRGFMAAAFTMHPGDMVEYTTAADEKTTIVFSLVSSETAEVEGRPAFLRTVPKFTDDELREKRKAALEFVLDGDDEEQYRDPWSQKLIYAAAACSIVDTRDERLLELSRNALERLAKATGADLSDEISKCSPASPAPNTLAAKSADQLSVGGDMSERCGICGSGMEWYSAREALCMDGHPFVRCGLTFLAIPEPDISKFCSLCGTEFLNDEVFGPPPPPPPELKREDEGVPPSVTPSAPTTPSISKSKFHMLFEVFDTCLYCGGKFRD